jgi:hypothetical protein
MKRDQGGSGLIETIFLGLLLLGPLIWGLTVLSELHRAALATTAAAREAGFDAARQTDGLGAKAAVEAAVSQALVDGGLDPSKAQVRFSSTPGLERGSEVQIEIVYPVSVVRAPFLGSWSGAAIDVRASHVARVDPYASRP